MRSREEDIRDFLSKLSLFKEICDTFLQQHPVAKINTEVKDSISGIGDEILTLKIEIEKKYPNV